MSICLQGSFPACIAAGILLLSKARRFGMTLSLSIVTDSIPSISPDPTLLYSPLLVGLGIPQASADPAMVILSGKSTAFGRVRIADTWYSIDRSGQGLRPETKELIAILLNNDKSDVEFQQEFFSLLSKLGLCLEPAMIDLFFAMAESDMEEAFRVLLYVSRTNKRGSSFYALRSEWQEDDVLSAFFRWEQRTEGMILGEKLARWKQEFLNMDMRLLSMQITPEISGIQRSMLEFLGSIGDAVDLFRILKERYLFLGGKFVQQEGRGYVYSFPESTPPEESNTCVDWVKNQAEIGSQAVESIWQAVMQPIQ